MSYHCLAPVLLIRSFYDLSIVERIPIYLLEVVAIQHSYTICGTWYCILLILLLLIVYIVVIVAIVAWCAYSTPPITSTNS